MAQDDLSEFVEDALRAGKKKDQIGTVLEKAGWTGPQVRSAIGAYADVEFPLGVPKPAMPPAARELFLYLLLFSALYMTAMGIGTVLYQLINLAFPDPSDGEYGMLIGSVESRLRSGVAILAVFLPAYAFVDLQVAKLKRSDAQHVRSDVRRKITYLTLYVAATILLTDLYYLIYSWLNGELFSRVLLKCLVVGGLSGLILGRYLYELRGDERHGADRSAAVRFGTMTLFVAGALVSAAVAMMNMSSPGQERQKHADSLREEALGAIDQSIMSYAREHKALPASLEDLSRATHVRFPRDPVTEKPYQYVRLTNSDYRLCTSFYASAASARSGQLAYGMPESTFRTHPAGAYCFALSAKAEATAQAGELQPVSLPQLGRAGAARTGSADAGP